MTPDPREKALLGLVEKGIGASADALAKISGQTWSTQSMSVGAEDAETLRKRLSKDAVDHHGALLGMPGAVFAMMLPRSAALPLAKAFLGDRGVRPGFPIPKETEVVAEIANVVVHAVANTVADACGEAIVLTAPTMTSGTRAQLLSAAMERLSTAGVGRAVFSYVHMSSRSLSSDCTVAIFLSASYQEKILAALPRS